MRKRPCPLFSEILKNGETSDETQTAGPASLSHPAFAARADRTGDFPSFDGAESKTQRLVSAMAALAPDPGAALTVSHVPCHPGEALEGEDGLTAGDFILALFEGNLFPSQGSGARHPERTGQAENDFTSLLLTLRFPAAGGSLAAMHMPAAYGAWLTLTDP